MKFRLRDLVVISSLLFLMGCVGRKEIPEVSKDLSGVVYGISSADADGDGTPESVFSSKTTYSNSGEIIAYDINEYLFDENGVYISSIKKQMMIDPETGKERKGHVEYVNRKLIGKTHVEITEMIER